MYKRILWALAVLVTLTGCDRATYEITRYFLIKGAIFLGIILVLGVIVGLTCSGIRIIRGFFNF